MLKPLEQFICDTCKQVIESPDQGYVEWESTIDEENESPAEKNWGFRIVHNFEFSPLKEKQDGGCYHYEDSPYRSDIDLETFTGEHKMIEFLYYLDAGPHHEPEYKGPSVKDMREYVEFMRRLTLPYYEEARLYWDRAEADGYFDGANELWVYLPHNLQRLIEKYKNQE